MINFDQITKFCVECVAQPCRGCRQASGPAARAVGFDAAVAGGGGGNKCVQVGE